MHWPHTYAFPGFPFTQHYCSCGLTWISFLPFVNRVSQVAMKLVVNVALMGSTLIWILLDSVSHSPLVNTSSRRGKREEHEGSNAILWKFYWVLLQHLLSHLFWVSYCHFNCMFHVCQIISYAHWFIQYYRCIINSTSHYRCRKRVG